MCRAVACTEHTSSPPLPDRMLCILSEMFRVRPSMARGHLESPVGGIQVPVMKRSALETKPILPYGLGEETKASKRFILSFLLLFQFWHLGNPGASIVKQCLGQGRTVNCIGCEGCDRHTTHQGASAKCEGGKTRKYRGAVNFYPFSSGRKKICTRVR